MKKLLSTILLAITMISLSGCFPIFIPVDGHHHGHHGGHYRH